MDLKKLETTELTLSEQQSVNGGNLLLLALASYMLYEIAANPNASTSAFRKGWNWEN